MSEYIEVGQPLQFTDPNTPTRVGEIVENVSDIYNIPSPRLGMQVFVKSEKKSFVITSLKSKVIGGVDVPEAAVEAFEPVGAKSFTWNNNNDPSNMNDFVVAGVYDIKGEHTRIDDNLPILNTGGGHSFNARLTVLDSSISGSGEDDDKCITQVLSFSNRLGQGEVYIRTGKGSSLDNLTWEKWSTLQRNVNVDIVTSLDHLVDNGIYSGVYVKTDSVLETFVLVVINNYALAGINNLPKSISQFKYSVSLGGSFANYETRVGTDVNNWGDWEILNKNEISSMISAEIKKVTDGIDPEKIDSIKDIVAWIEAHGGDVTAIYNAIQGNTTKITEVKSRAVDADSLDVAQEIDGVRIDFATLDDGAYSGDITIPAATTTSAGVMSATDKVALDAIGSVINIGEYQNIQAVWDACKQIALNNPEVSIIKYSVKQGRTYNSGIVFQVYHYNDAIVSQYYLYGGGQKHECNVRHIVSDGTTDDWQPIQMFTSYKFENGTLYGYKYGKSESAQNKIAIVKIPNATYLTPGLLSPEDKSNLNTFATVGDSYDLNTYTNSGVYKIHTASNEAKNYPIQTPANSVLRLTVIDSYDSNNHVITQVLNINNHIGGEGNVYIRSCQNGEWKAWGKLQTNIEVGAVNQEQLDALVDNGIYSGVLSTTGETFVIICINNYAIAQQVGVQHISHLKYSLVVGTGEVKIEKRTRDAYGFWTKWESLDEKSLVKEEKTRAEQAEAELDKKITEEKERAEKHLAAEIDKIKDGDTIVGQAREIHSRNGKTVTDSFLVRTTAGSGTIGDGVASLKSVGGNIVKNLQSINGANNPYTGSSNLKNENGILVLTRTNDGTMGVGFTTNYIVGHTYYCFYVVRSSIDGEIRISISSSTIIQSVSAGWNFMSHRTAYATENTSQRYLLFTTDNNIERLDISNCVFIDLTEMFGAGKEPDKATCDKLFGTMDALPQGLSIAKPTEFKSIGFNQFNPDNVLEGKAIIDNAIVSGDKKVAVIPCLPCKVGTGENNGYCIHGEFGDDIKVYLTPLNPMGVDGELYIHELTKDVTTDTYVPSIKGYMLVEVPTTANLCAHFLWSEDKCERDTYEPYFESKIELPIIPQMSEWGLAGIAGSGVLDSIDLETNKFTKRVGCVDLGSLTWLKMEPKRFRTTSLNMRSVSNKIQLVCEKFTVLPTVRNKEIYTKADVEDVVFPVVYDNDINIRTSIEYASVGDFKAAVSGVKLYYELATPEEYPLPKVDNNYISSDYGVEQFDSVVPCNANNLYYMRSLAGETRNFLDRMYDNTAKTDAKEVADYITNNLADKIPLATLENDGLMSAEDNKNLNTIIAFEFARVIGRTINPASGVFASVEGAGYLGVIPVKSGEKYLYSGRATQYNVGVAAYDENRAYLYPIICNVDNAVIKKDVCVDEPFTIPEGVAYIAVGTRYQESNPVSIKRVYSPKELADRKVPQLVSYDITDGYIVNTANGNVGAVAGSAVGSFIKVTEGEEFLITAKWGSQSGIAGYDKDKNYIIRLADATLSTFYSAAEVSDYLVRIPQGVEYIRVSTSDAVNYPLKVVKLVSIEDLTEKIPLCQNQFSYAWFGDSISQYGLPENVERKLGSSILDCSFAGAPLTYSTEKHQGTGFMTIASCIKNGDYTPIENALQLQSDAGIDITEKLVNLQHIKDANWKAISHFVVMAGTNDLSFSGATIDNIKVGLRQAFKDVISAYPHITIYFVSPPFRGNINSAAGNGLDLLEINEAIEDVCKEFNFPFLDFFHNCGVNQYNKAYYLNAQELHPNANGLALWSTKLANWLKSL